MEDVYFSQDQQNDRFVLTMPSAALPSFYRMLANAPLESRRWFYGVKEYLETNCREQIDERRAADE